MVRAAGLATAPSSAYALHGARRYLAPGRARVSRVGLRSRRHIATIAFMEREDAHDLIRREWIRWRNEHIPLDQRPTGIDAKVFYRFLQRKHPDLLDFPCYGDKWLIVHDWLLSPGAVSD